MKHLYILAALIFLTHGVFAQATNTFPANGPVGIGTVTPPTLLYVSGDHQTTSFGLHYGHPDPLNSADLRLWASEPGATWTGTGIGNNVSNSPGILRINTSKGASYMRLLEQEIRLNVVRIDGTDVNGMTINGYGNIGFGTTAPDQKLVVGGNIKAILDQSTFPDKNVFNIMSLGVSGASGARNWTLRGVYQYGNGVGVNAAGGDLDIIKSLDGNTILGTKFDGTALGNIGIGTTTPGSYRLAVNGNIRAKEIKVESTNWPDYVFVKDYQLPTLQQTAEFIKDNGHLPGIPNAEEVKDNGIDLGEMNAKLLKKIEELTLHAIDQEKRISTQEKESAALKALVLKMSEKFYNK
ncbi:hypothetical protein [Pedobacter metabolipauper]|uniref:Endosialidase-like protein n=1 Tax=Pedobacter metabolipauper TaxID=425513 RepID=A0A4R6T0K1_9SPHI|nr:hypothetical protein [Pedobacter metabolipauper]TDQ11559.1 hypothetical protein ATK78_0682 [Pedobacter metabolipauper]